MITILQQYSWRAIIIIMQEGGRRSSGVNRNKVKIMQQVLDRFTSKAFLTANSLFNNLYSSEDLTIDLSGQNYLMTTFGAKSLGQKQLYEYAYFHKRDKKVLIYAFLLHFLTKTAKFELVLMLNNDQLDIQQLQQFLGHAWPQFTKRIIIYFHSEVNSFIFNLQWLSQLRRQRQFLKGVIICDANSFDSSDKTSAQKYYRRIPRDFLVLSFRKDLFQYKIFHKSSLSYISDQPDLREMNQKLGHYLNKKIDCFLHKSAMLVPLEYVYSNQCKTIQDCYKTVILRRSRADNDRFEQIVFSSLPFHLDSSRQV